MKVPAGVGEPLAEFFAVGIRHRMCVFLLGTAVKLFVIGYSLAGFEDNIIG